MSIWKVILGFCLLVGGVAALGFTEVFTVRSNHTLNAVISRMTHIDNINSVDPANDGKLIHINGMTTTEGMLTDSVFMNKYNALCLTRSIYYYQWDEVKEEKEHKQKGGSKVMKYKYKYYKGWHHTPVNSADFKQTGYDNIAPLMWKNDTAYADVVSVGAFVLSDKQKKAILQMEAADIQNVPENVVIILRNSATKCYGKDANVEVKNGEIFIGTGTLEEPEIGDIKACLAIAKPCEVTVVGKQNGNRIDAYVVGDDSVSYIGNGAISTTDFITNKDKDNGNVTLGGRIFAFILMLWGLIYIFPLITKIPSRNTVLAKAQKAGGFISSLVLTLIIFGIVIGVAWILGSI